MQKVSRKAIDCLLSCKPGGEIPSLGFHILNHIFHVDPNDPNTLDLASDYYEAIEELRDKGLIRSSPNGYRLTDNGTFFLLRLRGLRKGPRFTQVQSGETSAGEGVVFGIAQPSLQVE